MANRLSGGELYEYLVALVAQLNAAGQVDAAKRVTHVSKFVSGSMSELFGEARLALPEIESSCGSKLSQLERARLREIVGRIDEEFRLIGGA